MGKKYFTPFTSDLYRAPIVEGDLLNDKDARHKYAVLSQQFGHSLLSSLNALIDVKQELDAITEPEALQVFNTARSVVVETIQIN